MFLLLLRYSPTSVAVAIMTALLIIVIAVMLMLPPLPLFQLLLLLVCSLITLSSGYATAQPDMLTGILSLEPRLMGSMTRSDFLVLSAQCRLSWIVRDAGDRSALLHCRHTLLAPGKTEGCSGSVGQSPWPLDSLLLSSLTRLLVDVGSGTYTGLCRLLLGSFFETLPPSRKNLDFTHPILQQSKGK